LYGKGEEAVSYSYASTYRQLAPCSQATSVKSESRLNSEHTAAEYPGQGHSVGVCSAKCDEQAMNKELVYPSAVFSVAPMMDLTDRHFRYLARLLTRHALLFSEMVTAKAILHGNREFLLGFNPEENPLALQLGGADPDELARAAVIGQEFGYDEINLNVGCPSDRVQSGRFGACLMAEPALVAECVQAMQSAVCVPVTVKCRIGIDRDDSYELFENFIVTVADSGCKRFYVHARKAWLDGLSPKENRDIPPLRYNFVYRLKKSFPHLDICINGGITDWDAIDAHLQQIDGVMLGRKAYSQLQLLLEVDARLFSAQCDRQTDGRLESAEFEHERKCAAATDYAIYMEGQRSLGVPLTAMSRHLVGLFQHQPGARQWRRMISSATRHSGDSRELITQALASVSANNPY